MGFPMLPARGNGKGGHKTEMNDEGKGSRFLDEDGPVLELLEKGQRGLAHVLFSRVGIIVLLLLIQLFLVFAAFYWLNAYLPHFVIVTSLFTAFMGLYLLNTDMDPSAKITWLLVILLMPVVGAPLYCYTRSNLGIRILKKRLRDLMEHTKNSIPQNEEVLAALRKESPGAAALAHYMHRTGCFPVYDNTEVKYYPQGEDKWHDLLQALEEAKHFIFLEYFIIDEGLMWGRVLEILAQKAKEGVDVRVMYDGTCEFSTLPHDYPKRLQALGIQCKMFAPMTPFISTHYNYRDHRKIAVIDGHTAFTGGVNLADEYINRRSRFGHWKDTAIRLRGEAVPSFTLLFLQMWGVNEKELEVDRFLAYPCKPPMGAKGFVLPYGDCPLDDDKMGERVYMDILNRAQDYVYIMSPYLILDGEMETALKFAAERGVDVRLVLPGIPDKKIPWALAKTHYSALLASGVKIYEYSPGFVHAKVFVADDKEAVVGTINLDYRSLYHHFECAAFMYDSPCIADIRADAEATMARSAPVEKNFMEREKLSIRLMGFLMKAIAPLL